MNLGQIYYPGEPESFMSYFLHKDDFMSMEIYHL